MTTRKSLTIETFTELWESKFLPSIKDEFRESISKLESGLKTLTIKVEDIESSQKFLSNEFDNFSKILQGTKKQVLDLSNKINDLGTRTEKVEASNFALDTALDNLQQYDRCDCIEVSGIPALPNDNPKQLAVELGNLMGLEITQHHISIAHRLPSTKKVKDRIIVKFVHRDVKEEFYKQRNKLAGKKTKDLPSVAKEFGKSVHNADNIFISESLTPYRKKLFGRINEYKRNNKWKYLWTVNGKILLRESDSSRVFGFTTNQECEDFVQDA